MPQNKKRIELLRKRAFAVFLKRQGKFRQASEPLTKEAALDIGAEMTARSLAATFKVRPVGGAPRAIKTSGEFAKFKPLFREYRIKQGRKLKLPDLTYIQKRVTRLGRRSEVREIQTLRRARVVPRRNKKGLMWFR
ncbi:hypothetical protein HYU13_01765 [Candidatus Woesearchaeota archaeon]|nr:hypothetical protein [Candidatus Woesearchaeota archaeon]